MKKIVFLIVFLIISIHADAKDYVIGDGDNMQISVWGNNDLSASVVVRPDGKISVPAVGEIKASGYTAVELAEILEKEMEKVVKTPIVTVIMSSMGNYRIFVFLTISNRIAADNR